ncbi:MAG: DUF790 family protein, partial [Ktedonobacteraceae bacterium]|nr:DUF790 family protein [Ktedonobacteraceae bacterium]
VLIDKQDETRKILVELVGFWHPNYLKRKVEKVRAAHCSHLLLLVYEGLNLAPDAFKDSESEVIFFQRKPGVREVMEAVEAMAEQVYGPRKKREKKERVKVKKPRTPKTGKK